MCKCCLLHNSLLSGFQFQYLKKCVAFDASFISSQVAEMIKWDNLCMPVKFRCHKHSTMKGEPCWVVIVQSQSCPTLCDPMDCRMQGFPVHHQLLEPPQTHVHWVSDAIQPSHSLPSLSPPTFNHFQHQGLFKWISSLHQVAKVLEFQLQHQSFQLIFSFDLLEDGLVGSPCSPWDSQESSPTPQFKNINFWALSFLYSPTLTPTHDYW